MELRALGVAFLVLAVSFGTAAAVPNAQLTVSDVTVDPEEPVAGEPFTITPTISSSVGSDQAVTIDSVTATVDGEQVGTVTNEGTLSPGDSVSVPFTTTIAEPGTHTIQFEITGTDEDNKEVTLTREETVIVSPVPDVRLTIDDPAVEPETPTAGAPVTVPVTVDSSARSNQPLTVDSVALLDGEQRLVETSGVGSLAIGDSISVPLTTTFDSPGAKALTVELQGRNAKNESVVVRQPLSLVIERGTPAIEMANFSAVEGTTSEVSVAVSNPTEVTLRNIVVTVDSDGARNVVDRRVVPSLSPGESTERIFRFRPEGPGETLLNANVSYTTAAGTTATFSTNETLSVAPLEDDVSVRVRTVSAEQETQQPDLGSGVEGILDTQSQGDTATADGDVRVTVSNLGNAPLRNVVLDPLAGEESLGARPVVNRLAPGTEESVIVSLEGTPPTEVLFEARYDIGTNSDRVTTAFDPEPNRGSVSVTGVDLEISGDRVEITGDIGNPGAGKISGVVVLVNSAEGVTPAYPSRDFFIGEIEGDGFAPFELTATLTENATEIPLEVQYLVDGDERTEAVDLPAVEAPDENDSSGPSAVVVGLVLAIFGLVLTMTVFFARQT